MGKIRYAANYTARLNVGYLWGGERHYVQFRKPDPLPLENFVSNVRGSMSDAMQYMNSDVTFNTAEFAPKGSDSFDAVDWEPLVGTGFGQPNNDGIPAFIGVVVLGEGAENSQVDWTFYGQSWLQNRAARFTYPQMNLAQRACFDLVKRLVDANVICAINNTPIKMTQYINMTPNKFLLRKYRQ